MHIIEFFCHIKVFKNFHEYVNTHSYVKSSFQCENLILSIRENSNFEQNVAFLVWVWQYLPNIVILPKWPCGSFLNAWLKLHISPTYLVSKKIIFLLLLSNLKFSREERNAHLKTIQTFHTVCKWLPYVIVSWNHVKH